MSTHYIELDDSHDGPKLQEFCKSVGILRYCDFKPEKGYFWIVQGNQLMMCGSKIGWDENILSFDNFKKLYTKETGMKRFAVNVLTPEISEVLQNIALKNGRTWNTGKKVQFTDKKTLYFDKDNQIYWASEISYEYTQVSIEEAIKLLSIPIKQPVTIEGYSSEYSGDTVSFGCKKVTKQEVQAIVKRIQEGGHYINGEHVSFDFNRKRIGVGGYIVTFEQINQVLEGFNN